MCSAPAPVLRVSGVSVRFGGVFAHHLFTLVDEAFHSYAGLGLGGNSEKFTCSKR